jgi:hypothetical protein
MAHRTESDVHGGRYGEAGHRGRLHAVNGGAPAFLTPMDADDAVHADDAISLDEVVERLSRDMTEAVHRAAEGERDELREYASTLAREQTEASPRPRSPAKRARITFVSLALWLAAAGLVLMFVLPPAGIVCMLMAALAATMAAVMGPGDARPERYKAGG